MFNVGDKIVGKREASIHYGITRQGWIGYVYKIDSNGDILVGDKPIEIFNSRIHRNFWVNADCFEKIADSKIVHSKPFAICQFCGQPIYQGHPFVKAEGGCKGKVIYAHDDCCKMKEYDYENLQLTHKETKSGFRWGCEFETNDCTSYEKRLQLWSWYKLICTSDCTVEEEFKSGINNGLHGARAMLDGIYSIVDIASGDNCGTHANVSLSSWDDIDFYGRIKNCDSEIFSPLADYLANNEKDTIKAFGRTFGSYREYATDYFEHGDWLQIKDNCLEFRLAKFVSTEQYFHLLCLLKEFCKVIDKDYLSKYDNLSMSANEKNANKVGKKLVKLFKKHCDKTATYFNRERNSKGV